MAGNRNFRVAVVIVNYNAGNHLVKCLQAVRTQTIPVDRCILVDNASAQRPITGTENWLSGIELIRLGENIGFAAANNLGVEKAEDMEWIALLNPDAFPEPDWLEKLLAAAEHYPQYSSFASRLLAAENPEYLDGAGDIYYPTGQPRRRGHGQKAEGRYLHYQEVFGPCAAAALYRTSAFLEVGGFDEDFFCYLEDIDLGFRLRLAGHRCLYVPEAVARHIGSAITGRRSDFSVYHGHRNLLWVYVKNMPGVLLWLFLPLHLAMNLAGLFLYTLRGQGSIIWRAKLDGVKGFGKMLNKRSGIQKTRRAGIREMGKSLLRSLG